MDYVYFDRLENDCLFVTIDSTCFQLSSDSNTFENPFRDGGKLSRDAEDIVIAVKTGKLSVGSRHGESEDNLSNRREDTEESNTSSQEPYAVPTSLVKPCNRKNAVIENVPASKKISKEESSHDIVKEKIKTQKCCVLS